MCLQKKSRSVEQLWDCGGGALGIEGIVKKRPRRGLEHKEQIDTEVLPYRDRGLTHSGK